MKVVPLVLHDKLVSWVLNYAAPIGITKTGMAKNLHLTPQFHWISFFSW